MFGRSKRSAWRPGDIRIVAYAPLAMFPGFAVADWHIAAKTEAPRLAARIGQQWRDPDDTYDTETHFRFPDGTRFIRGGSWSVSPPFAYAMNATEEEVMSIGIGATERPTLTNGSQTASITLVGDAPANRFAWALPAGVSLGAAQTIDFGAGKKVVEFRLSAPALSEEATVNAISKFTIVSPEGIDVMKGALIARPDGAHRLLLEDGGTTIFDDMAAASVEVLTVYMDADAEEFAVRRNGSDTPLVLTSSAYTPGPKMIGALLNESADIGAAEAGKVFSVDLRVSASSITGHVVDGYTDGDGVPMGEAALASNIGTRAGSSSSGEVSLTLEQMPKHRHPIGTDENESGGGSVASGPGPNEYTAYSGYVGGGEGAAEGESDPHAHTVNPEHSKMLVLVKL